MKYNARNAVVFISLIIPLLVTVSGCGCHRQLSISNTTDEILRIELVLPSRTYNLNAGCPREYVFFLEPQGSWSVASASDDEIDSGLLKVANGKTIVGIKPAAVRGKRILEVALPHGFCDGSIAVVKKNGTIQLVVKDRYGIVDYTDVTDLQWFAH